MSTTKASFVSIWIALSVSCGVSSAKYVEGILTSEENWEFLTRFCFQTTVHYKYSFEYPGVGVHFLPSTYPSHFTTYV
eukprot:m.102562 g.102562  ORF g.102562 m.102562 type:complete len:78 (+) comp37178_c0_seq3:31-264(+)